MIHEIRTYDLKARSVPEFLKSVAAHVEDRVRYSPLGGCFYTEIGPLDQVVCIWPYDDLNHRTEVRAQVVADGVWPLDLAGLVQNVQSDIYCPAPFMEPLAPRKAGPLFEMRIYAFASGDIPEMMAVWENWIDARMELSPLVGAWHSDIGGLNRWAHIWAYESFEHRLAIREEADARGIWPPRPIVAPQRKESKLMWAADFSPLQ